MQLLARDKSVVFFYTYLRSTDFSITFVRPDRDVAITPRSMGTSSGIEQGQRKLLLDLKSEKCAETNGIL